MGSVTCENQRLEIGLLTFMTAIVGSLAGYAVYKGDASASAAWSAILMAIVNSIKERWQNRTIDKLNDERSSGPKGTADDPIMYKED